MSVTMAGREYHWHAGEKKIHKLLKVERGSRDRAESILGFMPPQHRYFFANLQYFILGTLDSKGRPWASILTGEHGFIRPVSPNHLALVTELSEGDPVLQNLQDGWILEDKARPVAGLGIDLTNRRRNKVAGRVGENMVRIDGKELQLIMITDESLGNCPKYITVRDIQYFRRNGKLKYQVPEMTAGSLPREAIETIQQCDTVFMAARHLAGTADEVDDMDVNHRGGVPGYVRVEEDGRTLILPDYSGNLFYSTLGSIESDRLAALTFPNFITGDVLYVTGEAENLYGKAAANIMPRTNLVTRVKVTGYTFVESGLNLVSTESHPSPYNPPLKLLTSELSKYGKIPPDTHQEIHLVQAKKESSTISTFTFELPDGKTVRYIPGQHAILDFSAENSTGYRHMADEAPQSLNDDFIRSWTISSIPEIDPSSGDYLPSTKFSCTIKNKYGGAVSPILHRWARQRYQFAELNIQFIGVEGAFTCFDAYHKLKHPKLLFVAGGVGITPFLSMLAVLKARGLKADIVMLFSARGDDVNLGARFRDAGIHTRIYATNGKPVEGMEVIERRILYKDISSVPDLLNRDVYLCGPDGFMSVVKDFLERAGVEVGKVNVESFAF